VPEPGLVTVPAPPLDVPGAGLTGAADVLTGGTTAAGAATPSGGIDAAAGAEMRAGTAVPAGTEVPTGNDPTGAVVSTGFVVPAGGACDGGLPVGAAPIVTGTVVVGAAVPNGRHVTCGADPMPMGTTQVHPVFALVPPQSCGGLGTRITLTGVLAPAAAGGRLRSCAMARKTLIAVFTGADASCADTGLADAGAGGAGAADACCDVGWAAADWVDSCADADWADPVSVCAVA
jgi:hypothetical protein